MSLLYKTKRLKLIFFISCCILIYIFAVIPIGNDCEDKVIPKNSTKNSTCNHQIICFNGNCEYGDVCPLPCNSTERWIMLTLMIEALFILIIYLILLILYCIFIKVSNLCEKKNKTTADYDEI